MKTTLKLNQLLWDLDPELANKVINNYLKTGTLNTNKMENKYYTPEIEEFHVGFECEIQSSWGMQKGIYPSILREDTLTGFQLQKIGETETLKKVISDIRVKYLDKKDIESLNYKHKKDTQYSFVSKNSSIQLHDKNRWHTKYNALTIYKHNKINPLDKTSVFQGIIKNKSELKVLLKQLNIK